MLLCENNNIHESMTNCDLTAVNNYDTNTCMNVSNTRLNNDSNNVSTSDLSDDIEEASTSLVEACSVVPNIEDAALDHGIASSSDCDGSIEGASLSVSSISISSGDGAISSIQSQPLPSLPICDCCNHSLLGARASIDSDMTLVCDNNDGDLYSEIPDNNSMYHMKRISSSSSASSSGYEITRMTPPIPQLVTSARLPSSIPSLSNSTRSSPVFMVRIIIKST